MASLGFDSVGRGARPIGVIKRLKGSLSQSFSKAFEVRLKPFVLFQRAGQGRAIADQIIINLANFGERNSTEVFARGARNKTDKPFRFAQVNF